MALSNRDFRTVKKIIGLNEQKGIGSVEEGAPKTISFAEPLLVDRNVGVNTTWYGRIYEDERHVNEQEIPNNYVPSVESFSNGPVTFLDVTSLNGNLTFNNPKSGFCYLFSANLKTVKSTEALIVVDTNLIVKILVNNQQVGMVNRTKNSVTFSLQGNKDNTVMLVFYCNVADGGYVRITGDIALKVSDWSNSAPGVPADFRVRGGSTGLSLTWRSSGDNVKTVIWRSLNINGSASVCVEANASGDSWNDLDAIPGVEYWYRIKHVNVNGIPGDWTAWKSGMIADETTRTAIMILGKPSDNTGVAGFYKHGDRLVVQLRLSHSVDEPPIIQLTTASSLDSDPVVEDMTYFEPEIIEKNNNYIIRGYK